MDYLKFLEQHNISSHTKIAAVIGDPIAQSLSPYLHNYWLKKNKIDGVFIPLKVSVAEFPNFLKTLPDIGFAGCNVTIPHKESALKFCNFISKAAKQIGAVNTITIKDGKIYGDNSDHFGFIQNIKTSQPNFADHFDFKDKKVLLLGAGGAARAIIFGLLQEGVAEISICNRNLEKAQSLTKIFANTKTKDWNKRSENLEEFDLLINSTSLGMVGKDELEIDLKNLKKSALVCDIVYKPLMTKLLTTAQNQGNPIITGIGMLIYQGSLGFEKWFGIKPQVDKKLIDEMTKLSSK